MNRCNRLANRIGTFFSINNVERNQRIADVRHGFEMVHINVLSTGDLWVLLGR